MVTWNRINLVFTNVNLVGIHFLLAQVVSTNYNLFWLVFGLGKKFLFHRYTISNYIYIFGGHIRCNWLMSLSQMMLKAVFYFKFHSWCISICIDIYSHHIQKLSLFAYFDGCICPKKVWFVVFPGLNFWNPSLKWFLKEISFRR